MNHFKSIVFILAGLLLVSVGSGCTPTGPCEFTGTTDLTAYRLPDPLSPVFGTIPAGETHEVLARTADGWIGFDPGIAQAGNVGLARHRWIELNAALSPFCLASVDLVTLGEIEHDIGQNQLNPPDLVITSVVLPSTPIKEYDLVPIEVTIENQGGGPSTDYEILIFPQYSKSAQTPAEQELVPDLDPGDTYTFNFLPGVSYSTAGDYVLRVLVTDDWTPSDGDPTSIGTNGDKEDVDVQVSSGLCSALEDLELSVIQLVMPGDTRNWPVYLKVPEGYFPGFDPQKNDGQPPQYIGKLGEIEAYKVDQQGFPDRLYFMFNIPEGMEGTTTSFQAWAEGCQLPFIELPAIQIPLPLPSGPVCTSDLNAEDCKKAGGSYEPIDRTGKYECVCP